MTNIIEQQQINCVIEIARSCCFRRLPTEEEALTLLRYKLKNPETSSEELIGGLYYIMFGDEPLETGLLANPLQPKNQPIDDENKTIPLPPWFPISQRSDRHD